MYDAVPSLAGHIPPNAYAIAYYADGTFAWTSTLLNSFAAKIKLGISTRGTNVGMAGDCEPGDMTTSSIVDWVQKRRASGFDPLVYTSSGQWASVVSSFNARAVRQPVGYWIAHYNNSRDIPTLGSLQAVAKQYFNDNSRYDKSCLTDRFVQIMGGHMVDWTDNLDRDVPTYDPNTAPTGPAQVGRLIALTFGGWYQLNKRLDELEAALLGADMDVRTDVKNALGSVLNQLKTEIDTHGSSVDVTQDEVQAALANLNIPQGIINAFANLIEAAKTQ
jgi:hypothetical protein